MKTLNLAVIEDSDQWQYLIKSILARNTEFNITLTSNCGDDFLKDFSTQVIDFILLDITLPHTNGFTVARQIQERYPTLPIVILTASKHPTDIAMFHSLGLRAYINKSRILKLNEDLCIVFGLSTRQHRYDLKPLNREEVDLIAMVCQHLPNNKIGERMHASEKTVEYKLKKLCDKVDIHNNKLSIMEFAINYGYW